MNILCWLGFHKDIVFKWQNIKTDVTNAYKWNNKCLRCGREKQLGWWEYIKN